MIGFAFALLVSCSAPPRDPAIAISVIDNRLRVVDPDRSSLSPADRVLLRETAMGLVTFDAMGQVDPGLAESWIVTEDGLSIIFRIARTRWPDASEVSGQQVAASLARAVAPTSRNTLRPLLGAIDRTVGMTGRVVEIRLKTPRPNMLQLLAQPELGIRHAGQGAGPWRAQRRDDDTVVLTRVAPGDDFDPESAQDGSIASVVVRAERASLAVARFLSGGSVLVQGGTIADWPLAQAAKVRGNRLRLDPAEGLFGLAIHPRRDLLRDADMRAVLAMSIDRVALAAALGAPRWQVAETLLPAPLDSGGAPARPEWAASDIAQRRERAGAIVTGWVAAHGEIEPLTLALPGGPGMTILFARIVADLRSVGISVTRVAYADRDADLTLIDEVAPSGSANWYLTRTSCTAGLACSEAAQFYLEQSRAAPSFALRTAALRKADNTAVAAQSYIPLGQPLRWSLVDPSLDGWRENAFAVHPLRELRRAVPN